MSKWTTADIPDQTGRTAVITGANTGLGYETAAALAAKGVAADSAAVNTVMGLPKPEAIRILLDRDGPRCGLASTAENINAIHDDFTARMRRYYVDDPAVREIPGAAAAFAALRGAGVKVALNTGFFRPIVDALLARRAQPHGGIGLAAADDDGARRRRALHEAATIDHDRPDTGEILGITQ